MIKSGLIVLFLLLASFAVHSSTLKVMTWNVYMLPKPLKMSNQKTRMGLIAKHLKKLDHDMIVLQEAFSPAFRKLIARELAYEFPYQQVLGKNGRFIQVMNSGVYILSRKPFTEIGRTYYYSCASFDCFASKGAILIKTQVDDQPVQIAVTHMQSGERPGLDRIRRTQLVQIRNLLDQNIEQDVPQILMGDINIDALKGTEFSSALSILGMTNSPLSGELQSSKSQLTHCLGQPNSKKVDWIDHMLVRGHQTSFLAVDKRVHPIQDYVKGEWCDLSDHYPVEGSFSF